MFQVQAVPITNDEDEVIFYTLHLHEPNCENGPSTPRSFKNTLSFMKRHKTQPAESKQASTGNDPNEDAEESKLDPELKLLNSNSQSGICFFIFEAILS